MPGVLKPSPSITKYCGITVGVIGFSLSLGSANAAPVGMSGPGVEISHHLDNLGTRTDIVQAAGKAIIDWQSFDTRAGDVVTFIQPDSSAIALNRVHDSKATVFDGALNANGQVWLVNPHGMVFGPHSQVNVGGLLATSSDMSDEDFRAGNYRFTKSGDPDAKIVNLGSLHAKDQIILAAPGVSNQGAIIAQKVHLAAGDTYAVDLYGDGLINLEVTGKPPVMDDGGIIIADDVTVQAAKMQTDESKVLVHGTINARNESGKGGKVKILGDNIALLNGTVIDASGRDGGGDIKIGGDYLGGGTTQTAQNLFADTYTLIYNDALISGNGGRTILWSDGDTTFRGNVYARGGALSGDGGFLETSGHEHLTAEGFADLTAPHGVKGTYLLDPANISIFGNVDPRYASTDGTINLAPNLKLWLDASDTASVTLTYSNNSVGTTASGTTGTNTITTAADVSAALAPGARIRLTGAGAATAASTMGANTYTIASVNGTTITTVEPLTTTYAAGTTIFRGLVSQASDRSGLNNHATQGGAAKMPLWISNGQNGRGVFDFDGVADSMSTPAIDFSTTSAIEFFGAVQNEASSIVSPNARLLIELTNNFNAQTTGFALGFPDASCCGFNGLNMGIRGNTGYNVKGGNTIPVAPGIFNLAMDKSQAAANESTMNVNGAVYGPTTMGFSNDNNNNFANDVVYIGARNNGNYFFDGKIWEMVLYNQTLSTNGRALMNQYQSAKWGVALTGPGSGSGEAAQAMSSLDRGDVADGYSVFTTRYLERLSQSADIDLRAGTSIKIDLKNDTLNLASGRSIALTTTTGDITSQSNGTIQTSGGGNISLSAGGDINFAHDLDLTTGGAGTVTLRANNNIISTGSGDITTAGGTITINSNRDAVGSGAISLGAGTTLASNNGDIILGGGANPLTTTTLGNTAVKEGVWLNGATLQASTGNISIRGTGYSDTGDTVRHNGVQLGVSSISTTGEGNITMFGQQGDIGTTGNGAGISGGIIQVVDGDINMTGYGSNTTGQPYREGIIVESIRSLGTGPSAGTITLNGRGGDGLADPFLFAVRIGSNKTVQSVDGAIAINDIGTFQNFQYRGFYILQNGRVNSTGTAAITLSTPHRIFFYEDGLGGGIVGTATTKGPITFITDNFHNNGLGGYITTTGNVTFRPFTSGASMGVGAGAGNFRVRDDILPNITASSLTFGDTVHTGVMTINSGHSFSIPTTFLTRSGSNILLSGILRSTSNGNALTLASGANFVNSAGANALSTPAGNWRVYSANPALDTKNGLNGIELFGAAYPYAVSGGNYFLYSYTPSPVLGGGGGGGSSDPEPVVPVNVTPEPVTPMPVPELIPSIIVPRPVAATEVNLPQLLWVNPTQMGAQQNITAADSQSVAYSSPNQQSAPRERGNEVQIELEKKTGSAVEMLCKDDNANGQCSLKW